MPNTFLGLTIGSSGLYASNAAINTVAHNVANINTKGYSRQYVSQEASFGIRVYATYGTVGTGVKINNVEQVRSEYYDARYRYNNSYYGMYSTLEEYSTLVEDYLDEFSKDGFITEYNNFFNTINSLMNDPSSQVNRNQFVNYASSICQYFNNLSTNLENTQLDINLEVKSTVESINTIAAQIAGINKQINTVEINGGEANDLRDQRNLLVEQLSEFINVDIIENDLGGGITEYNIYINEQMLVGGYNYNQLVCVSRTELRNASDASGLYDIKWDNGLDFNPYDDTLRGSLKALIDIRDGCNDGYETIVTDEDGVKSIEMISDTYRNSAYKGIPYYQSQLNEFVTAFAKEFNDILLKGQTADGETCTTPFFTSKFNTDYVTAANIQVDESFIQNLDNLPYSYDVAKGVENDDMLKDLMDLNTKVTIGSSTFWEDLTAIVSDISVDTIRAKTFNANYTSVREVVAEQRMSIMGVDEDEEGVDLVRFQHAYELSSKVISVMAEIYDKLIQETGV